MKNQNTIKKTLIAAFIISLGFSGSVFAKTIIFGGTLIVIPDVSPNTALQNDMVYSIQNEQNIKLIAPTELNIIPNVDFNLSGTIASVNSLEKTKLVNKINPNNFASEDVGAIAINNSDEHMIAAGRYVPVDAANKLNEDEFQILGAAYKIENEESYDFIIPEPILK